MFFRVEVQGGQDRGVREGFFISCFVSISRPMLPRPYYIIDKIRSTEDRESA